MQITIEKLVYGGDGLARTPEGVVFVPKTAPGDVVEVEITQRKKDYATGRVREIVTASEARRAPTCPNYDTVGCCHWEHIRYDKQLEYKEAILRESLTRLAKIPFDDPIKIIKGPHQAYRLRAGFHLQHGTLGFVRQNSNTVVPIQSCTALAPDLNAFIPAVNALQISATAADVVASGGAICASFHFHDAGPHGAWERLRDALFRIPRLAAVTFLTGTRRLHYQTQTPIIEVAGNQLELSSDAFFQANRFLLDAFVAEVVDQVGSPSDVLELFSGAGFFTIPIAKRSRQVIGVESNRVAVKQAQENAKRSGVWNMEVAAGNADAILASADAHPEVVVLNPPRAGAGTKVAGQIAALKSRRIVYVSCNPTTFARESAVFIQNGYRMKRVTMVDQFPNTYHIELVAQFELE